MNVINLLKSATMSINSMFSSLARHAENSSDGGEDSDKSLSQEAALPPVSLSMKFSLKKEGNREYFLAERENGDTFRISVAPAEAFLDAG